MQDRRRFAYRTARANAVVHRRIQAGGAKPGEGRCAIWRLAEVQRKSSP
jgi:hypothetical protein